MTALPAPDQSTNINLPSGNDLTGLAVAMGRIEQNQINTKETVDKIDQSVSGLVDTVSSHNARLAVLESQVNPRAPWYIVIGGWAGIASLIGVVIAIFALLNP